MNAPSILVASTAITERFMDPVQDRLSAMGCEVTRFRSKEEWLGGRQAIADFDVLFIDGHVSVDRATIASAPKLRAIIAPTTGTEGVDMAAASELGIIVGNGQTVENYTSMAEAAVMLTLVSLYDIKSSEDHLRSKFNRPSGPPGLMLRGKTIGILGLGKIGQTVCRLLQPWGATLQAVVRSERDVPEGVSIRPLETVLETSDVIIVLLALNDQTRGLLDEARLRRTQRNCVLINIARGGIIDEAALCKLVIDGHFRHVALDVFDEEPLPADSPLRQLPRTTLTPHCVGHTAETVASFPDAAMTNIVNVLRGSLPAYVRNPDAAATWSARWANQSFDVQGGD